MVNSLGTPQPTTIVRLSLLMALLLGIRFSASAAMAGASLTPETVASLSSALDVYDGFLPLPLIVAFIRLSPIWWRRRADAATVGMTGLLGIVWGLELAAPVLSTPTAAPVLASLTVALGSVFCLYVSGLRAQDARGWAGWAYLAFLLVVPLAFALRTAAYLGLGTSVGAGGTLQGIWLLVYAPTVLLTFLAVVVWANLALDAGGRRIRERWTALLPFVAVPLYVVAASAQPLAGYILSAFITWGSNLALFTPPLLSVTLAVVSVAAFVSSFLLSEREHGARALLFVGTAIVVLAGFYVAAASVAGIVLGMLAATVALGGCEPRVGGG